MPTIFPMAGTSLSMPNVPQLGLLCMPPALALDGSERLMFSAIPGYAHLKLLVPETPAPQPTPVVEDPAVRRLAHSLVTVVVEVAAGLRPFAHLNAQRFGDAVRLHVRACKRRYGTEAKPVLGKLVSIHGRSDGEVYGTASLDGKNMAFTASLHGGKLTTFRLL